MLVGLNKMSFSMFKTMKLGQAAIPMDCINANLLISTDIPEPKRGKALQSTEKPMISNPSGLASSEWTAAEEEFLHSQWILEFRSQKFGRQSLQGISGYMRDTDCQIKKRAGDSDH